MKTINKILSILMILLIVSSCREITITTKVHKNGSFTRTVTITGDSADVFKPGLPYPIDSSWAKTIEVDTADKEKDVYTLIYSKTFKSSKHLNKEISQDTSWRKQLDRKIEVNKRYGVFYSYLTYKETIGATNPFTALDYRDYLNEEDLLWISCSKTPVTPNDSVYLEELEGKAFEFVVASALEELYQTVKEGIVKLDHPGLTTTDIEMFRDSIVNIDAADYSDNFDDFYDNYARWSNDTTIYLLQGLEPPLFSALNSKFEEFDNVFDMDRYFSYVVTPGLITETNSIELQGNQVKWEVDSWSIMFEDREMYVESRIVNVWGFILIGITILCLLVVIVLKTRTNRKNEIITKP